MTIIKETNDRNGSRQYCVEYSVGQSRHSRSFTSRSDAEDFVGYPSLGHDPGLAATRVARAAVEMAERPRREQRTALMRLAFETCARLGEIHLAEWKEFDLNGATWTIPAEHAKCRSPRTVPLSKEAIAVLAAMSISKDASDPRVFHKLGSSKRVNATFSLLMNALGMAYPNFSEFRNASIDRMVVRHPKLSLRELEHIVDRRLGLCESGALSARPRRPRAQGRGRGASPAAN